MNHDNQVQQASIKSFTSKFFGNYLDNSQIDLTGSDIDSSNTSAIIINKSLTQQQIKAHHLTSLLHNLRNISLRQTIYRWIHQKQYRKRLQKRTPNYIAKVLLKVCMLLNVKFKTRCHYFFARSRKITKNKNTQIETPASQPNIANPSCQHIDDDNGQREKDFKKYKTEHNLIVIDDQKENILDPAENNQKTQNTNNPQMVSISNIIQTNNQFYLEYKDTVANKYKGIIDGVNKLTIFIEKNINKHHPQTLKTKSFHILKKNNSFVKKNENLCKTLNSVYLKKNQQGMQMIKNWIDSIEKIQILKGTILLIIHPHMRYAFLALNIRINLNQTEISQIQSNHSQRHSFQINQSAQQLVASLQPSKNQEVKIHQENNKILTVDTKQFQNGFFRKKDNEKEQNIHKNNPKNLKFTRDLKQKKPTSKCNSNIEPKIAQTQIDECSNLWRKTVYNSQQMVICGEQNYLIQFRKENVTSNNSASNITLPLKRAKFPLTSEIKLKKANVICHLNDNQIQIQMNNTDINQNFVNISQSFRSRPIRNDDMHPQIPDFNDLFFLRQINNFYHSIQNKDAGYCCQCQIHQNHNKKSKSSQHFFQGSIIQKQSNHSGFRQSFNKQYEKSFNRNNYRSFDKSPFIVKSKNKQQHRIPNQLPRNFDYYVDKGFSSKMQQKKLSKSEESSPSRFNFKSNRQSIAKTNSKQTKKLFNVVKSGRTQYNKIRTEYTPQNTDRAQYRKKSKTKGSQEMLQFKMASKRNKHDNHSQYLINFGDPPKRKLKKRI